MKEMTATVQGQRFIIKQYKNGTFGVKTFSTIGRTWEQKDMTFKQAGMWVWNMADNHDIGHIVNERMCDRFGRTFA